MGITPYRYLLGACLVLLVACAPENTGPAKLDNYLTRLGRVIEVEIDVSEPKSDQVPRLTRKTLKPLDVPSANIDVLDFLSLSGCDLQVNLGRRNSGLGRQASPSQKLLLDLEFLDLAPTCIQKLQDDGNLDLASTIEKAAESRHAALPKSIYNAIFTGPEWLAFWRLPETLGDYPRQTNSELLDNIKALEVSVTAWLNGDYRADNLTFELLLSELRKGDGGALLLAASWQGGLLARADHSIITASSTRGLCPFQTPTAESKAFENVVAKYFAGEVQGWSALLSQRWHDLDLAVHNLERLLEHTLPEDYRQWQEARDAFLTQGVIDAPREHVKVIKAALAPCATDFGRG